MVSSPNEVIISGWDLADSTTELTVRRDVKRKNQYFLIRKLKGNKTLESSFNFDAYTPAILNGDKFQVRKLWPKVGPAHLGAGTSKTFVYGQKEKIRFVIVR